MADNCNPHTFLTCARMPKATFIYLLNLLQNNGGLEDSIHISAGEKLMTFMFLLSGDTMRKVGHRWQHSMSTIRDNIDEIIAAVIACKPILMRPASIDEPQHPRIARGPKYSRYFQNCMGALDGSHIHAVVSADMQPTFRNRKQFISQNVNNLSLVISKVASL